MAYIPGFGHLSNPYIVFNDANGKPLSNGTVETYIAGTTTAYNTLKDWNGTYNGAIITLDIYGGCTIIAPETQGLKLIVKTSTGAAYKTFDNVFIGGSNQGYLPGTTTIRVDGTDGEIISVGTPDPDDPDKLIFTISLDPAITEAIATNTSDISGIQTHIGVIENNITLINDTMDTLISGGQVDTYKVKTSSADAVPGFTYDKIIVEGILTKNKAASDTFGEVLQLAVLDKSVESINVIEVVENGNHAATVTIPYGYFNKIANIRSTLSSLTLKMSELPDTDHAYSFHATMTPLSNLGITTFKVVGPGNSILAIGETLTSKVIRFSADQLNHLYASLADQTLVTATASISYAVVTHTLSVGTETIVLDGAATDDAYFVCSGVFGVVTAIGAMEFDPPTLYRDVTWLGTAPALVGGKTYEISVVNGCGVIGGSV